MTPLYRVSGEALHLGRELGSGGEARVYTLTGAPTLAVKLYHETSGAQAEKLTAMIGRRPHDPTLAAGHVSIAWPQELVLDGNGAVRGFIMPSVDTARSLPLHQVYHPKSRLKRARNLTWRYLLRIAHNLATVVAALHRSGYVVGDLNESNVLVFDDALVTLVDCDSVQVRRGLKVLRCTVGKVEYTAPELQGRSFREVTRQQQHDRFALASLIFLLLMEGSSPFAGVYLHEGEPPLLENRIRYGHSPYLGSRLLAPSPLAPPFDILPPEARALLKRGLRPPRLGFSLRPSASQWQRALRKSEARLTTCADGPNHVYSAHLKTCPWCARREHLGLDAYPPAHAPSRQIDVKVALEPFPAVPPVPSVTKALRAARGLPLVSLLVTTLAASLASLGAVQASALLGLEWPVRLGIFFLLLLLLLGGYLRALAAPRVQRVLGVLERSGRAAIGATLVAVPVTILFGWLLGWGSVLEGDWLLLPTFWLVVFLLLWRLLARGPLRS